MSNHRVTDSFCVNLTPALVTSQRNHLIQKREIQKSFNRLCVIVHRRERERMNMCIKYVVCVYLRESGT